MRTELQQAINRLCRPLEPIPTGHAPRLERLQDVRCVMFDIYGTLLISASGDIVAGAATGDDHQGGRGQAFVEALGEVELRYRGNAQQGPEMLEEEIAADHAAKRQQGVEYPEVDIRDIWRRTLARLVELGLIARANHEPVDVDQVDVERLAFEYELRVNPVWPMPHASSCLAALYRSGVILGIISNAQFLTIDLWQALLRPQQSGFTFHPELQYYSYQYGWAKPGLLLYEKAAGRLAQLGIAPQQVLYIGNDMLRDVYPASKVGFRTALFAGDARSLRLREDDPRVAGLTSDLVITDLADLPQCVCPGSAS